MNAFKITYEDGNASVTNMNADLAGARRYFVGQVFQFGDTEECPRDRMVRAVSVEQIDA